MENSKVPFHIDELNELLNKYDFHLLDNKPKVIEKIGFVGNIGWYNGDFFDFVKKNVKIKNGDPNNWVSALRKAGQILKNEERYKGKLDPILFSNLGFFYQNFKKLRKELRAYQKNDDVDYIVASTHYLPTEKLIAPEKFEDFNYKGTYLGSNAIGKLYTKFPKLVLGLCGHDHSPIDDRRVFISDKPIYNVTAEKSKPYHIFDIMSDGSVKNQPTNNKKN